MSPSVAAICVRTMNHIKGVGVAEGLQSVFSQIDAMLSYTLLVVKTRSRIALFFCEQ